MVISNNRSLLSPKNRSLGIFLKRARRKTSSLDDDSREKESGRASKTTEPGRLRGGNEIAGGWTITRRRNARFNFVTTLCCAPHFHLFHRLFQLFLP